MCATWLTCEWQTTCFYVTHRQRGEGVTWPIHMWDMTHSCVRHESFVCDTRLCCYVWYHRRNACVTWLNHMCDAIHMWDMTHSCVRHESFVCDTRLTVMCDIINEMRVWRDSITRVMRCIRACDMAHSLVWHDLCVRVTWLTLKCMTSSTRCVLIDVCVFRCMCVHGCVRVWTRWFICVTYLMHICDMTHIYLRHYTFIFDMIYVHMWCVENESCHTYVC